MPRRMRRIRGGGLERIVAHMDERQTLRSPCPDQRRNGALGFRVVQAPSAGLDRLLHVDDDENRVRRQAHGRHGRRGASAE